MIPEEMMVEIIPKPKNSTPSNEHVQSGLPIHKVSRVKHFSPLEWEEFIAEWASSIESEYVKVRRLGGSGDFGVDIVGFKTAEGWVGEWHNYQCKHYNKPLTPSDVWVEIGKIIYYSFMKEYNSPEKYYFVCSSDTGTKLEMLLNNPDKLKIEAAQNWDKYCKNKITSTHDIPLKDALLNYFDTFDFNIFTSKSLLELINEHAQTRNHAVWFGGGLPPRPKTDTPPFNHTSDESNYIIQIFKAYSDHLRKPITCPTDLDERFHKDYCRQRERFFSAEALKNFARDTVPEGTFDNLTEEIYYGVIDTCENEYPSGYKRMSETLSEAGKIVITSNPLTSATKIQDRQGICHQLANQDRLTWVPSND